MQQYRAASTSSHIGRGIEPKVAHIFAVKGTYA
jgi:hypothetical protein